jgi:hypothetical protein
MPRAGDILVDNATISSVFRALGYVRVDYPATLDVDQVALERFTEAVLLGERIVIPDNYKPAFRAERKRALSASCFVHSPVPDQQDTDLGTISRKLSAIWFDAFQEGRERGTFARYFEQTNAFTKFIWERSSSEFWLVFRAVGVEDRSPLIDAFLSTEGNALLGKEVRISGTQGQTIEYSALSKHVKRMVNTLAWLGHQYIWYQAFAANAECTYLSHPLREFFAYDFMSRLSHAHGRSQTFAEVFTSGMQRYSKRLTELMADFNVEDGGYQIPNLLPLILSEAKSGADFIEVATQMREEPAIREFRELLWESQALRQRGDLSLHQRLTRDFAKVGENILRQRGIDRRYIKFGVPSEIVGVSISGDDLGVELPIPALLYKQFFLNRRYRVFLRSVMNELATVATIGDFKDRLDSLAWINPDASEYPAFYAKSLRFGPYTRQLGTGERPPGRDSG